ALCGLYASGLGFTPVPAVVAEPAPAVVSTPAPVSAPVSAPVAAPSASAAVVSAPAAAAAGDSVITELGKLFAGVLEQGMKLYGYPGTPTGADPAAAAAPALLPAEPGSEAVVISGAGLGLPGVDPMFDDANIARILSGQQLIGELPMSIQTRISRMRITRLVKDALTGGGHFEVISDPADVIKLAGRHAPLDMVGQYGIDAGRDAALDSTTRMAVAAGFDALRDAGIPLVMHYKKTTIGTQLPDKWGLPLSMRDDTGIVFASAFPGYDNFAQELEHFADDRARREHLLALEGVRARVTDGAAAAEIDQLIAQLKAELDANPFEFDRRFLFRVLAMGHSQFAEIIGARGPNTQLNAACSSTTQAISVAEDWIRAGRCRRVIIVTSDDATSDNLMPWVGSGFLATGAAATDARVEDAALPFDRRRHGMIVGAGAAALIIESAEAARERGVQPIAELLGVVIANSAYHGTRLDIEHIAGVMDSVVRQAERRGVDRHTMASSLLFMSHETFTPARGGSAAAEINSLRSTFGPSADKIVIANTKGFTGHAMGAGVEDAVMLKALETGIVPPVPNLKEPDPGLGNLNLSKGGSYPVHFGLHLAAGFGSQIGMSVTRYLPMADGRRRAPEELGYAYRIVDQAAWQRWLDACSGHSGSQLEVDHRRLRIVDTGAPAVAIVAPTSVPVPYAATTVGTLGAPGPSGSVAAAAPIAAPAPVAAPVPAPAPVAA
ncbi:MAG: beta-ketoacyl synthase N-terminal-like domain-containing protein, partial [Candidatus Phosphoribacter sp.]